MEKFGSVTPKHPGSVTLIDGHLFYLSYVPVLILHVLVVSLLFNSILAAARLYFKIKSIGTVGVYQYIVCRIRKCQLYADPCGSGSLRQSWGDRYFVKPEAFPFNFNRVVPVLYMEGLQGGSYKNVLRWSEFLHF
jgi:hypothetical protein